MDSNTMDVARHYSENQKFKPQEELPNQKLPYELLLILFSYLRIPDDLVSVQRVCSGWRAAALDKSLWKKYCLSVFNCKYWVVSQAERDSYKNIYRMPGLRKMYGTADNSLIDPILENIIELNKLNVDFVPPLTHLQLQAVLEKYPELESISLCLNAPNILKCLELLKSSKYLMEVKFFIQFSEERGYSVETVFHVFTDSKNFPALRRTNLVTLAINCFRQQNIFPAISTFVSNRSNQLVSLDMELSPYLNLRETVSKCTKLRRLDLTSCMHPSDILIDNMTELRSLSLYFSSLHNGENFNDLQEYFYRGSWEYLTKVSFVADMDGISVEKHILYAIIKNVKRLKDLHYNDTSCCTNESELCEVGNLPNLKSLTVCGLNSISEVGMSYVSSCPKLKKLKLAASESESTSENIEHYVRNKLRKLLNLKSITFKVYDDVNLENIKIRLIDREEIEKFISS